MTRSQPECITELATPAIVGKRYVVPFVAYPFFERYEEWPVFLPKHSDPEVGFEPEHYHLDGRFFSRGQWGFLKRLAKRLDRSPEMILALHPLLTRGKFPGGHVPYPDVAWRSAKVLRIFLYPYEEAHRANSWHKGPTSLTSIANAHEGKALREPAGRKICPHKGAALGSVALEPDGSLICPLHGLRFVAGVCRRRADVVKSVESARLEANEGLPR